MEVILSCFIIILSLPPYLQNLKENTSLPFVTPRRPNFCPASRPLLWRWF